MRKMNVRIMLLKESDDENFMQTGGEIGQTIEGTAN